MVKVTIDGTPEEVNEAIQRMANRGLQHNTLGVSWLPEEIEQLFGVIQDGARDALRQIVVSPARADVLDNLGVGAHALSGMMSSVEFQRKRLFPAKRKAVTYDYETEEYRMLPEVAEWIRNHPAS